MLVGEKMQEISTTISYHFFFCFPKKSQQLKALVVGHTRYGKKEGANKFIVDNALVCEFHLTRTILTYPL